MARVRLLPVRIRQRIAQRYALSRLSFFPTFSRILEGSIVARGTIFPRRGNLNQCFAHAFLCFFLEIIANLNIKCYSDNGIFVSLFP